MVDTTEELRRRAVAAGAVEVKCRDLGMLMRKRNGKSFDPECVTCAKGGAS